MPAPERLIRKRLIVSQIAITAYNFKTKLILQSFD